MPLSAGSRPADIPPCAEPSSPDEGKSEPIFSEQFPENKHFQNEDTGPASQGSLTGVLYSLSGKS